jgi:hypothetical protein
VTGKESKIVHLYLSMSLAYSNLYVR